MDPISCNQDSEAKERTLGITVVLEESNLGSFSLVLHYLQESRPALFTWIETHLHIQHQLWAHKLWPCSKVWTGALLDDGKMDFACSAGQTHF